MTQTAPLKVHITGVYGLIGNLVYRRLSEQPDRYDVYGSGRRSMSSTRAPTLNPSPACPTTTS